MRYVTMADVQHLAEKKHGCKIKLLAKIVAVARRLNQENSSSSENKKRKKLPSSPPLSNSGREISRKQALEKPMKDIYQTCDSGLKLKFINSGVSLFLDQELPTSSKSSNTQEAPTSSGSKSFKKIEEVPKVSGLQSLNIEETPTSSGKNSRKKIEELPKLSGLKRQGKSSSCSTKKKQKVGDHEGPSPGLAQHVKDVILELAGGSQVSEPILVVQKKLYSSDIKTDQNRFLIPTNQMKPFLDKQEIASLPLEEVVMIEPNLNIGTITLAKWSNVYILRGNWSKVVRRNSLDVGMLMQLWAVRIDKKLLLVLVRLPPTTSEGCNNGDFQGSHQNVDRED